MTAGRYPLVTIEGCDGVGKSTIRDRLCASLLQSGVVCRMVGQHSWLSPVLGQVILNAREGRWSHDHEAIVQAYSGDKRLHADRMIVPALATSVVLADRYILSDAVYQEALYGIPAERSIRLHSTSGIKLPDIILFVDVDVDEAYRRVLGRQKHTRHYERPTEMSRIIAIYRRVLLEQEVPFGAKLLRYDNNARGSHEKVTDVLAPELVRMIRGN